MGLPLDNVKWYPTKAEVPASLADGTRGILFAWDKDKSSLKKKEEE